MKKTKELLKAQWESDGAITFSIRWNKSRTWGFTAGVWCDHGKIDVMSGCGYDKTQAAIESVIMAITGQHYSYGGQMGYFKNADVTIIQEYSGKHEDMFRIVKGEK